MRICFDLDNTICVGRPYEEAQPILRVVDIIRKLRARGHTVIIYTARGMGQNQGSAGKAQAQFAKLIVDQLTEWGIEYDELYFGKPDADLFVDDKAFNISGLRSLEDVLSSMEKEEQRLAIKFNSQSLEETSII